MAKLFNN